MILFRLISFGLRVFLSFLFVFILQIRWDGKTLESYLIKSSKSFFAIKVLNQTGQDGTKTIRHISSLKNRTNAKKKIKREISNKVEKLISKTEGRIELPEPPKKKVPAK